MASQRHRGRPGDDETLKGKTSLLIVARDLFARHGYHGVSIRRLADAAGVNSSLIQYHFGGKRGLYEAMFEEAVQPLFEQMTRIASATPPGANVEDRIRDFFTAFMGHMARTPWLPPLLVRDVLAEEGIMRETFLHRFAEPGGRGLLGGLVRSEAKAGRLRRDLDPNLTALSMISLALFPFVALPIAGPVLGVRTNPEFIDRLVDHTAKLFYRGAASSASPGRRPGP